MIGGAHRHLVHENDRRRMLTGHHKQLTHLSSSSEFWWRSNNRDPGRGIQLGSLVELSTYHPGSFTNVLLDELRPRDTNKAAVGVVSHCTSEQSLPSACHEWYQLGVLVEEYNKGAW